MAALQRVVAFIVAAGSLACSSWCHAQGFADVGVETAWHDNLTRSERPVDAREDLALALTAVGGVHLQPGIYTGLTLSGSVNRTQFRRYTGLSNTELGLAAALTYKFGLGERQPVLTADAGVARNEYNLGIRDAWIYRAGLGLRKRLTDTLNLSAALRYEKRDGDHDVPRVIPTSPRSGASWDVAARSFVATAEQELGALAWLGLTYQYQRGDVVSTSLSYPKIFDAATAITLDPLYGPFTVAYRIPARTHILALDLNRAVLDSGTVYVGIEYQRTHGRSGIDYDSGVLRAGFIHGF